MGARPLRCRDQGAREAIEDLTELHDRREVTFSDLAVNVSRVLQKDLAGRRMWHVAGVGGHGKAREFHGPLALQVEARTASDKERRARRSAEDGTQQLGIGQWRIAAIEDEEH